jgi:magnesium-transporting ATPase (P-type)
MNDRGQSGEGQSGEDQHERLNRQFTEILQEARTAILGVQVLFVFLLRVPFSQRFPSVSTLEQYVFYATLLFTLFSAALLMAPTPHHRILWREHQREKRLVLGNWVIMVGLAFLALAIEGSVFLISDIAVGRVGAALATLGIGLVFLWLWYGQPIFRMRD